MNLTSIGLGRELLGENVPSLWQSLIEFGSIALLMLDSTLTALLKSDSKRDDLIGLRDIHLPHTAKR